MSVFVCLRHHPAYPGFDLINFSHRDQIVVAGAVRIRLAGNQTDNTWPPSSLSSRLTSTGPFTEGGSVQQRVSSDLG